MVRQNKILMFWFAALMGAGTCLVSTMAISAEACRECYIWQKPKAGPDVAKVWCCFNIRYELKGTMAEQDVVLIRKMLASLATVTGLTFNEVVKGGDLILFSGPAAYETALMSADADPDVAKFNQASPEGVLNGLSKFAIKARSPCIVSAIEDDNETVQAAIVITTADVSLCLEKTLKATLGLQKPSGGNEDAVALCNLYASYRRFARSYEDISDLVRNSAVDCGQF